MIGIHHLLSRQLPEFVKEKYPTFCKFLDYYYRWLTARGFSRLEDITNIDLICNAISISTLDYHSIGKDVLSSYIGYEIKDLKSGARASIIGISEDKRLLVRYITKDAKFCEYGVGSIGEIQKLENGKKIQVSIDKTESIVNVFIENFAYMLDTNGIIDIDKENAALLMKHIKEYYTTKGTEESVNFLLYVLKGVDSTIMYPWENVLKPSDGHWHQYYSIVLSTTKDELKKLKESSEVSSVLKVLNYGVMEYQSFNIKSIEFFKNEKYLIVDSEDYEQYVRIHLYEKPNVSYFGVDSLCQIETSGGVFSGLVAKDVIKIKIVDPGSNWSVGEVFKIGGTDEWKVEDNSYDIREIDPITDKGRWFKRSDGVPREIDDTDYNVVGDLFNASVAELPFLGRITAIDETGIASVEILQQGEYISDREKDKVYEISPLLYDKRNSWDSSYSAKIQFVFDNEDVGSSDIVNSEVGYWEDEKGFLSYPDIVLQDSSYFQQFSYDIFTDRDAGDYIELLKDIHPSGTKQFNTQMIVSEWDLTSNLTFDVAFPYVLIENAYSETDIEETLYKIFRKKVILTGVISASTESRLVEGEGTRFLEQVRIGDKIYTQSGNYLGIVEDILLDDALEFKENSLETVENVRYKKFNTDDCTDFAFPKDKVCNTVRRGMDMDAFTFMETGFIKTFIKGLLDVSVFVDTAYRFNIRKPLLDRTVIGELIENTTRKPILDTVIESDSLSNSLFRGFSDNLVAKYSDIGQGTFIHYTYTGYDEISLPWVERIRNAQLENISYIDRAFPFYLLTNMEQDDTRVFINNTPIFAELDGVEVDVRAGGTE